MAEWVRHKNELHLLGTEFYTYHEGKYHAVYMSTVRIHGTKMVVPVRVMTRDELFTNSEVIVFPNGTNWTGYMYRFSGSVQVRKRKNHVYRPAKYGFYESIKVALGENLKYSWFTPYTVVETTVHRIRKENK